jgi:pyruvate dehydrogenase complex dehydrogenase (E1) component
MSRSSSTCPAGGRQIALIGDAELDEGACWEAIADPMVARLGEVMWVVDLNRQSLDRVVPRRGTESTQQAFGRFWVDLAHEAPEVAARVVTVSPDVGTSTNLGGWINKAGIFSSGDRIDWFADDTDTLVRWRESGQGKHIELGIAEVNLVGLLGEVGATWPRHGRPLLPVGSSSARCSA